MNEFNPPRPTEPELAWVEEWVAQLESEAIDRVPELVQELRNKHEQAVRFMLDSSLVQRARAKLTVSERVASELLAQKDKEDELILFGNARRDPDIRTYIDYWNRIEQSVYSSAGSIDGFGLRYIDPGSGMVRLQPRHLTQNHKPPRVEYIDCLIKDGEWHTTACVHKQSAGGTAMPVTNMPDISAAKVAGLLDNASHSYDQLLGGVNA